VLSIAVQYPARTDDNGVTWFRPQYSGKTPPMLWGWTASPNQAHPAYDVQVNDDGKPIAWIGADGSFVVKTSGEPETDSSTPTKEEPTVEMTDEGEADTRRYSEYMRYPLPPFPEQVNVDLDRWKRYKVPSPTTGKLTSFPRATTIAGVLDDGYNLERWKQRTKVEAVIKAKVALDKVEDGNEQTTELDLLLADAYRKLLHEFAEGTKVTDINKAIDLIDDLAGGAEARELGGFVHDWLGELDMGKALIHQLPEMAQPYAAAYQKVLLGAGLVAVPQYVERLVLNDQGEETVCGRLDRIYRVVETGELVLGDLKTSEKMDFSYLEWAVQFAVYGYSTKMLSYDRKLWEPMPKLNDDYCVVVWMPRTSPEKAAVIPFDLYQGGVGMIESIKVRQLRNEIPKKVLGHTTPTPSKETLRWLQARQALQAMTEASQANAIINDFEDVWDSALDEFGATCFELLTPSPTSDSEE